MFYFLLNLFEFQNLPLETIVKFEIDLKDLKKQCFDHATRRLVKEERASSKGKVLSCSC